VSQGICFIISCGVFGSSHVVFNGVKEIHTASGNGLYHFVLGLTCFGLSTPLAETYDWNLWDELIMFRYLVDCG
jgi:hypothetical protein